MSQFSLNLIKFEDVRQQIINYLQENSQYAATFDWMGPNLSYIIDTMAYVTMLMSYQTTNIANNNFLDTTTIRKNAVSIAKTMGYRPHRSRSAQLTGLLQYKSPIGTFDAWDTIASSGSKITIIANSIFMSNNGRAFTNLAPIELIRSDINAAVLQGSYSLVEGIMSTFEVPGTNLKYQTFTIPSLVVSENYFKLETYKPSAPDNGSEWMEIKNAFDLMSGAKMYYVEEDTANEGYPKIVFGGYNIDVPAADEMIRCTYLETTGAAANGDYLVSLPTLESGAYNLNGRRLSAGEFNMSNFDAGYQDSANTAFGGSYLEPLEDIKISAPRSFATAGRAVTPADFKTLMDTLFSSFIYRSSVIGGEELYPGDSTKLGNIFITAMPYIKGVEFDRLKTAYLNQEQETNIIEGMKKYSIISTITHIEKPSYVRLTVTPYAEVKPNISVYEKNILQSQINTTITNFFNDNFADFGKSFRKSKLDTEVNQLSSIKSSDIQIDYEFMIQNDSFNPSNLSKKSAISLPVQVASFDRFGKPDIYTNFVRTNLEQMQYLKKDTLSIDECTIYGKIFNPNSSRYMYNRDVIMITDGVSSTEYSEILIDGKNLFMGLLRVNNNLTASQTVDLKLINNVSIAVTPEIVNGLDNWIVTAGGTKIGKIIRNNNTNSFAGQVKMIPAIPDTNGVFFEVIEGFNIPTTDGTEFAAAGDYIIYNQTTGYYQIVKLTDAVDVSAVSDVGLYVNVLPNEIYQISGDLADDLFDFTVSAGDYVIYNPASSAANKWEKMNFVAARGLDASLELPIAARDYELRFVENTYVPTTFGNTTVPFDEGDLIFYNPSVTSADKWQKIVNIASSASMAALPTISAAASALGSVPVSSAPIGTAYRINSEGDPLNYIVWPDEVLDIDKVGYIDDIIVSLGASSGQMQWAIFANSYSNIYSVDGSNSMALPSSLGYGDYFTITTSGNFQGMWPTDLLPGAQIVYIGNAQFVLKPNTVPVITTELPPDQALGNIIRVIEAGNFNNNYTLINPTVTASPASGNFIQGDYLIYTGNNWIPLREYTFKYASMADDGINGNDYLNNLGFSSFFIYEYSPVAARYNFYFNDQFHDQVIGQFRYNVPTSENTALKYEVGKLIFNDTIEGQLDLVNRTFPYPVKTLFNSYGQTDPSLIDPNNPNSYLIRNMDFFRILPKFKYDAIKGHVVYEPVTDFDNNFNQYIIPVINSAIISNEIV